MIGPDLGRVPAISGTSHGWISRLISGYGWLSTFTYPDRTFPEQPTLIFRPRNLFMVRRQVAIISFSFIRIIVNALKKYFMARFL
jgi:hypothetical protein